MKHETWDKLISCQGKSVTVYAVTGFHCLECGEAVYDAESYDRVGAAGDTLVKAMRRANPPEVRVIREKLGLTQAQAGKIFGGGVNAFSRYERGESKPSTPNAKALGNCRKAP